MTLTLLLDLDDTLLSNDIINAFLPAYLGALGNHMVNHVSPDMMVKQLLAATEYMIANNSPVYSLERVFDQHFYPSVGKTKEELRDILEQFYNEVYPALSKHTTMRPEALELVNYAKKKGHTAVVATNPLFPRTAVLQRLRWAGFDPDHGQFALITTFENFHFAKPNPAYLAEILAQLGWLNQPAVMVGNSIEDDLFPAAQLGLPVYWVVAEPASLPIGFHPLSASGTLFELPAWLDLVDAAEPRQKFDTPTAELAVLKSTPAALDTFSLVLTERQWKERPGTGDWTLTEIFCHMRDVDREINIPRMTKIMDGSNPFVPGINSDTWAEERDYYHQDGRAALQDFIHIRSELIRQLGDLPKNGWELPARHAIFGPTNIKELVGFIATHDRSHIQQVLAAIQALKEPSLPGESNLL